MASKTSIKIYRRAAALRTYACALYAGRGGMAKEGRAAVGRRMVGMGIVAANIYKRTKEEEGWQLSAVSDSRPSGYQQLSREKRMNGVSKLHASANGVASISGRPYHLKTQLMAIINQ